MMVSAVVHAREESSDEARRGEHHHSRAGGVQRPDGEWNTA